MNFLKTLSEKLGFTTGNREEYEEPDDVKDPNDDDEEYEENEEKEGFVFPTNLFKKSNRRNKNYVPEEDETDDEEDEEDEPPRSTRSSGRRGNVIHDSRMDPRAAEEIQYTHCERIVNVRQIEECREIIKYLLRGESILLNLENIDPKDCGRVVDLLSGAAFALQGRMLKVAHLSYLLAPENVEVIEEDMYAASRMRYR